MEFDVFLNSNVMETANMKMVVSKSFGTPVLDADGNQTYDEDSNPVINYAEWEFRKLTADEDRSIRASATRQITAESGITIPRFDQDKYAADLIVASCVYPNLRNKELNDSWGTIKASDLLLKMLSPGEYQMLQIAMLKYQGFDTSALATKKDHVKN